ncbi:dicer-like protein 2 [Cladorrhinum sp. PSN259]|nr:dicer-like protein 2 [Cladorrhinum sp. PSN259]
MASYRDQSDTSDTDVEDKPLHVNRDDASSNRDGGSDAEDISTDGSSTPSELKAPPTLAMTARAYQLEMLEESLKRNIIVAMDTGTGKTQVAVLRIKEEIERSDKLVWFLAPTVELASQQFEAITSQISEVQAKFISGASNVDSWKMKPGVWDAVLANVRIVVSTYQILFDASVSHAFVKIESLGLVVIDEAHNCIRMNPVARFMKEGYARAKAEGRPVPHILGLTASPLMSSNLSDIDTLEKTLDAICKTPKRHRSDLMARVNRPDMIAFPYGHFTGPEGGDGETQSMSSLLQAYNQMDIRSDPRILRLRQHIKTESGMEELRNAVMKYDTPCQYQMKSLCNRAKEICTSIGPWAADYYIHRVVTILLKGNEDDAMANDEKVYLTKAVVKVKSLPPSEAPEALCPKTQALVEILESYEGKPVGIVFVKERATAVVLSHTLSAIPSIASRYRVGSMVGSNGTQKSFLDLSPRKEDLLSLQQFRKGRINLLVATSVLEEGIDVPVCNLVICFEKPSNLKSFIQRRGRARMSASQLYLLVVDESDQSLQEWQNLEREMKERYENEMREMEELEKIEDSDTDDYPVLKDMTTGAQLAIHDAKSHLDHFCTTLSSRKFVNWNPFYTIHDLKGNPLESRQSGLRKATVHLPMVLPPELRKAESLRAWPSEANACKDAAFQAYRQLYEAGLVNSNLLPVKETDLVKDVEPRDGLVDVRQQYNPWTSVAQAWRSGAKLYRRKLMISDQDGSRKAHFEIVLPIPVPYMEKFTLYWDHRSSWEVITDAEVDTSSETQNDHALTVLAFAFSHRFSIHQNKQYPVRLVCLDQDLSVDDIAASEVSLETLKGSSIPLLRHIDEADHPYFYNFKCLPNKPPVSEVKKTFYRYDEAPEDSTYLVVRPLPKKAGFFQRPRLQLNVEPSIRPYPAVLPISRTRIDNAPSLFTYIGMLVPAITSALETHLVATELLESRLQQKIGITDLSLVLTAITCPGARLPRDYERIEFLGDSILKFCTSIYLCAKYMYWPEGYLSASKDKIISNSRLYRAAVEFGLDRYIIAKAFTQHKWRPMYVEDLIENASFVKEEPTRKMSTKTLADIVEALIGASFITGGAPKALKCMSLFLPEVDWTSLEEYQQSLYKAAPEDEALPLTLEEAAIEDLIGYAFTKKALLIEAMTHPSYSAPGTRASFDRLEFLGDAILDYVVVSKLFEIKEPRPLENSELHLFRTALVNADILGFLVMEWCREQESVDAEVQVLEGGTSTTSSGGGGGVGYGRNSRFSKNNVVLNLIKSKLRIPLSSFMRHSSPELGVLLRNAWQRHEEMREELLEELFVSGRFYPWSKLLRLQGQKVQSDLFEALVGAVWIDSGGSIEACEEFIERAGILRLMRRLLEDKVHLLHPKEELNHFFTAQPEYRVYSVDGKEGEIGGLGFGCDIHVRNELVASFPAGGISKEDARVQAAENGCKIQRRLKNLREKEAKREEALTETNASSEKVVGL